MFSGFIKRWSLLIHIANGTVITAVTILMSLWAFRYYSWEVRWNKSNHSAIGLIVLIGTGVLAVLGYLSWGTIVYRKSLFWRIIRAFQVKNAHKYLGYFLIFLSQIATLSGVVYYLKQCTNCDPNGTPVLGIIAITLFLFAWLALEV